MASETPLSPSTPRNIVIVGGGIIGCTTAYFLTRHPAYSPSIHKITLIEANSIASGASGKAGGLLALWAYPSCIVPLSFRLHAELAKEHDGAKRWGYRAVCASSITAKGKLPPAPKTQANGGNQEDVKEEEWKKLPKTAPLPDVKANSKSITSSIPEDLDWFDTDCIRSYSIMGDTSATAQVHPYQFTTSIASLAEEAGAKIIYGSVTALDYTGPHGIKSVTYEDKGTKHIHTIPATDVVLSAGPWTSHVWPEAPIDALRAHSVTFKADVTPYAIFTDIELPKDFGKFITSTKGRKKRHGKSVNPEMYARPNGEVYACGEGDSLIPLPKSTDLVQCDESRCDDIVDYISTISPILRNSEVTTKQACYLPLTRTGDGPLIGQTGIRGLLIAAGHTCWGIQNSCATGKLMSEFVFDGKAVSANIDELDPRKIL
ncbi:FAD dependent oxidoreductase [Xylogone sp. PMI_703]|nr:FAD dependent oxidoreductase [Xylogone sp. PMI_703]